MRAIALSYLCGVINFVSNMFVFLAAQTATANNQNTGIVAALSNGGILFGLFGSYFVYKENITRLQIMGSIACLIGLAMLSLSMQSKEDSVSQGSKEVTASNGGGL